MASVLTNFYGNTLLQDLATNGGWLSLHESDPTVTGDPSTEVPGTTRAAMVFSSPSGKAIATTNAQQITTTADAITYLGINDQQVGGHLLVIIDIHLTPLDASANGFFIAEVGDIAVQL